MFWEPKPLLSEALALFVAAIAGASLLGQVPAPPDTDGSEGTAPASRDSTAPTAHVDARQAADAFEKAFTDYRAVIRQIEQLRIEYQTTDAARREKINAELAGLLAQAKPRLDTMTKAAESDYRSAPNDDPRVTELLTDLAKYYIVGQQVGPGEPPSSDPEGQYYPIDGGDQYERGLPFVKLLVDGGAKDNRLYVWGFLAAFVTNDYDLASDYFKQAQESKAFEQLQKSAADTAHNKDAGLDGEVYRTAMTYAESLDKYRQLWAKESEIRAAEARADDLPRVKLTTTKGDITLELFENEAPQTVANFITLVKSGFYDGSPFHRVLPFFVAQGGAKSDDGEGGPGYAIRCECYTPEYRHHFRGSLSMAHRGRDTGGSQFFLTFVPTGHLDGKHTVFGRVIDGFDVLGSIQRRSPQQSDPPKPDRIVKAVVLRDRGHPYTFERLSE